MKLYTLVKLITYIALRLLPTTDSATHSFIDFWRLEGTPVANKGLKTPYTAPNELVAAQ